MKLIVTWFTTEFPEARWQGLKAKYLEVWDLIQRRRPRRCPFHALGNQHSKISFILACRAGVILASECPVFFEVKIIAALFDIYSCKRLGRERNLYQGNERRSLRRRGKGVGLSLPLPLTVYSYSYQTWPAQSDKRSQACKINTLQ